MLWLRITQLTSIDWVAPVTVLYFSLTMAWKFQVKVLTDVVIEEPLLVHNFIINFYTGGTAKRQLIVSFSTHRDCQVWHGAYTALHYRDCLPPSHHSYLKHPIDECDFNIENFRVKTLQYTTKLFSFLL